MGHHFIHYVRRSVRLGRASQGWPFYADEDKDDLAGLQHPLYHETRRLSGPSNRIQEGDHIWIVGQLFSPLFSPSGWLPPALDARIDVAKKIDEIKKIKKIKKIVIIADVEVLHFEASATSRWFPLADASTTLAGLKSRNARGEELPLLNNNDRPVGPVGTMLQGIRELTSAEPLQAWERQLDSNYK